MFGRPSGASSIATTMRMPNKRGTVVTSASSFQGLPTAGSASLRGSGWLAQAPERAASILYDRRGKLDGRLPVTHLLRVSSKERVRRAAGNFRCDDSAAYFTKAPE